MSEIIPDRPAGIASREDLAGYLREYARRMALSDEQPAAIVDCYHAPDVEYWNDGMRLDRERLIEHARPARRNVVTCDVEVHEALVAGDRVAARYRLSAAMRKGRVVTTDIHMFGRLAPDGRLRRIDQLTRPAA